MVAFPILSLKVDLERQTGIPPPDNLEGLDHAFLLQEVRLLSAQARDAEQVSVFLVATPLSLCMDSVRGALGFLM